MSTELEWTLRCDREGCDATIVARGVSDESCKRKVIRVAREVGWLCNEVGDFCATCRGSDRP